VEDALTITLLNDFIFCPASIYFHNMYQELDGMIYKDVPQIVGASVHRTIDEGKYTTKRNVLQGKVARSIRQLAPFLKRGRPSFAADAAAQS